MTMYMFENVDRPHSERRLRRRGRLVLFLLILLVVAGQLPARPPVRQGGRVTT